MPWHRAKTSSRQGQQLEQLGPSQGNQSRGLESILPRHRGNEFAIEIYATKVHTIRQEIKPEIPHQSCQADDDALESLGCTDVPSVSIEPRCSRVEMV
ncbi:hypothetical protein Acr_01g0007850 [Actinidia rufa]|uniref:Uncharacterized protein n=1 Tax=Actinidia rufa TaxID=165716 RepID=A0A7J0E495_9ERIC|nr:hypothetical protein Acr_01g0007850 [Actinidia rufa]